MRPLSINSTAPEESMDSLARSNIRPVPQCDPGLGVDPNDDPNGELQSKDRRFAALMRAAQDGDRAAYSLLLKEVVPVVKRLVQSRLRYLAPVDREDTVQDIL